jgi:flagellar basal-body rod modification protein FlgD
MSAISGLGSSAGEIRTDYLNLLVTQLRNQNPLEPLNNNEMASQLAQLSQLEQLESISSTFGKVFLGVQLSQARELIGQVVSFMPPGQEEEYWGKVDRVDIADGRPRLWIGDYALEMGEIRSVYGAGFTSSLLADQLAQASDLLGKEVSFVVPDENGEDKEVVGRVDSVLISDGQVLLKVGENTIKVSDIQAVRN